MILDFSKTYSFDEFRDLNDNTLWPVLHEGSFISGVEYDSENFRIIPMPQVVVGREVVVSKLTKRLEIHCELHKIKGWTTTSQGGFVFDGDVRAPDVAFIPKTLLREATYRSLFHFDGEPIHPSFLIEVEDLTDKRKLDALRQKVYKYFQVPEVQECWLVDFWNNRVIIVKPEEGRRLRKIRLEFDEHLMDTESVLVSGDAAGHFTVRWGALRQEIYG
ncbi:hypothetical protein ROZALSC1DRAFT_26045, partial [Rozella allomycis CSF55]